ncbi:MAG: helix-turn-helix domain-containing protein [Polyangiaceae bacterium]
MNTAALLTPPPPPFDVAPISESMVRAIRPPWQRQLTSFYALQNVISRRPQLPLYVIQWDGERGLEWMELGVPSDNLKPFHFEIFYGKESKRDQYYLECLRRAKLAQSLVVEELFGFADLFLPIQADDRGQTFLYAGQFLTKEPEWEWLAESWRQLTGREPTSANADFVRFVRMALSLPVLSAELLSGLERFLGFYAAFLTAEPGSLDIQQDVDELNSTVFDKLWPIDVWVESAISADKFHMTPWYYEGQLTDWLKEGIGIQRLPTTAMTLMPLEARVEPMDPVRAMIRNARIQRALIAYVREWPETAAVPLSDYGVSFITSPLRGKSDVRQRLELRERAERLQQFVYKQFGLRSVVGIGRSLPAGSSLYESHRQAVLALHLCLQLEQDVLFHEDHYGREQVTYSQLQDAATDLSEAFGRQRETEIKVAADRYVRLVLIHSDERIEVVRSQFLAMLFQLFGAIQRRHPMRQEARDRFAADLTRRVEEATTASEIIDTFKAALERLAFVSQKSLEGPKVMRLEATLQYLKENFAEQLRLPDVARKAGFSVPAFSRVFKQATGTSFLAYVRAVRVEHAKRLLATTPLTTEQIAQASGFQSQHHLIRSFKKVTGDTPGAYRKGSGA